MRQITYEPMPGEDIAHSCRKAADIATKCGDPVSFRFNGVDVTVQPGESSDAPLGRWNAEIDRRAEAYRNSDAGRQAAIDADESRHRHQKRTDALMDRLPNAVNDLGELVRWCVAMSDAADHVGVTWDRETAIEIIETAGYAANAHVGKPKAAFDDPGVMGEYIVGQALDCMAKGMPPHAISERFATEGGFVR